MASKMAAKFRKITYISKSVNTQCNYHFYDVSIKKNVLIEVTLHTKDIFCQKFKIIVFVCVKNDKNVRKMVILPGTFYLFTLGVSI